MTEVRGLILWEPRNVGSIFDIQPSAVQVWTHVVYELVLGPAESRCSSSLLRVNESVSESFRHVAAWAERGLGLQRSARPV